MLIFTYFSSTNNSVFLTEKPDEHNYSKNHLEMDSEVDEFDRQIAHLTKISSDEDNTVELSDDEKKSEEVKSRVDNLSSLAPDLLNESLEKPNINFRSASPRTDGTKEFKDAKEETTRKVNYLAKLTKSNPKQGLLKSVSSQNTERVDEDDNLNESEDERKSLYANRSSTPNYESRKRSSNKDSHKFSYSQSSQVEKSKPSREREYFDVRHQKLSSLKSHGYSLSRNYESNRDSSHVSKEMGKAVKSEYGRRDRRRSPEMHDSPIKKKKQHHRSPSPITKRRSAKVSSSSDSDNGSPSHYSRSRSSSDLSESNFNVRANRSLKSLVKESKKAVNKSYGSYTPDGIYLKC